MPHLPGTHYFPKICIPIVHSTINLLFCNMTHFLSLLLKLYSDSIKRIFLHQLFSRSNFEIKRNWKDYLSTCKLVLFDRKLCIIFVLFEWFEWPRKYKFFKSCCRKIHIPLTLFTILVRVNSTWINSGLSPWDRICHIKYICSLHNLFCHIWVSQIFKDKASWSVIELAITEGYFNILNIRNYADLLIIASKTIIIGLL